MEFFKNLWNKITSAFSYFGILSRVRKLADTFPGVEDQEKLRLWIIKTADEFVPVVAKTDTPIDDKIVEWVQRIAVNEKAFAAIYNLALVAYEKVTAIDKDAVYGMNLANCDQAGEVVEMMYREDATPQDAISIIMAIGVIMQIISLIREIKKQRGEL